MTYIDFLSDVHTSTKRDYLARVNEMPKAEASARARQWGYDYWDGDRRTGYGGYTYDGRWQPVARALAEHYQLRAGDRVLDVGCGKGFLLFDLLQQVPGLEVAGIDISAYAIEHSHEGVRERLIQGSAAELPCESDSFDLVISLNVLHNLYTYELERALRELERVGRREKYVVVESYRTESEKMNLLYWQLTCEQFCTPEEWQWWFDRCGYTGDHSFIYFE